MSSKKSLPTKPIEEEAEGVPTSLVMLSSDDRAELIWLVRAATITLCKVLDPARVMGGRAEVLDPEQIFDGYVVEHFGVEDGVEKDPDDIPENEVIDDD
jgi:hypothetical protein